MIFNKYEFKDKAKWLEVKQTLYITEILDGKKVTYLRPEINSIVEIGFICFGWSEGGEPECIDQSTMFAVDMLLNEPIQLLDQYIVWPSPCGIHTFEGLEKNYLDNFCKVYPDSKYCK